MSKRNDNKNLKHNKKRNVGIIYEQLVRTISENIIDDRGKEAEKIIDIVKRRFAPGSELYKEFRLFNALARTRVNEPSMATRIISEAKNAAKDHDEKVLDREKSLLIKEINTMFDSKLFYTKQVPESRTYATIQTLLNDWRCDRVTNFQRVANFEKSIHEHLLRDGDDYNTLDSEKTPDVNSLTVKIMSRKFSDSFSPVLTGEQKSAIQKYVLSFGDDVATNNLLYEVKEEKKLLLRTLNNYTAACRNKIIKGRIPTILENIDEFSPSKLDDSTMAKYLTMINLRKELSEPDDE